MIKRLAVFLALVATPALAEDAGKPMRLIGAAPAASEGAPLRFVIDALVTKGYGPLQTKVEGWLSGLDPVTETQPLIQGKLEGACIEDRCALSADVGDKSLLLSGDLGKAAGAAGRFMLQTYDDKTVSEGPATFTPLAEDVPGIGRLIAPYALTGQQIAEPLLWAGFPTGYANIDDDPPSEYERKAFSDWQAARELSPTGLFTVAEIALVKAEADKAKADVGWTLLPGVGGWKAGYPAKVVQPVSATSTPGERRYASADGKVLLVTRTDQPMGGDAWDAFVKTQTTEAGGRETNGYARVNEDFDLRYTLKDRTTVAYYFSGPKGMRRMEFSYPTADDAQWSHWGEVLRYAYRAGEAER